MALFDSSFLCIWAAKYFVTLAIRDAARTDTPVNRASLTASCRQERHTYFSVRLVVLRVRPHPMHVRFPCGNLFARHGLQNRLPAHPTKPCFVNADLG